MVHSPFTPPRLLALGLALLGAACASGRGKTVVDLKPAQEALAAARDAGAPSTAAASYAAAEAQLKKAEDLAPKKKREAREAALAAEWMARLAASEARCATTTATARSELQTIQTRSDGELQRLQARMRKGEEGQRQLEELLAAKQRDLEVTEMELIRTKARLKGLETKAEASSAIAEARILLRRAEGRSGALLTLGEQSLAKAEQQLSVENYGAASFFALRAQDLANRAQDGPDARRAGDAVLPLSVRVRVNRANLRQGPGLDQKVLTLVPRGTMLPVRRAQGDWFEITHGELTAWVSRTVVVE
jgi:chromosome segregation ATPase